MVYEVRYSRRTLADLDAALAWLTPRSPVGAALWRAGLLAKVASLEQYPARCAISDEAAVLGLELRELLYGRRGRVYRILFTIDASVVYIVRIRHAAQDRLASGDI